MRVGIKKTGDKKDLALIWSEARCSAAAVYTRNKVIGQPLVVTREHLADGYAQAVIVNSGNANTCNGEAGIAAARRMAALVAERLPVKAEDVVVASTGVIGVQLDVTPIEAGMEALVAGLSKAGSIDAREAILTTDTMKKELALSIELGGKTVTIGAMAKGSGMIHPNMATMLGFITTDCAISPALLQEALSESVRRSYQPRERRRRHEHERHGGHPRERHGGQRADSRARSRLPRLRRGPRLPDTSRWPG